jgi:hypothetical protein
MPLSLRESVTDRLPQYIGVSWEALGPRGAGVRDGRPGRVGGPDGRPPPAGAWAGEPAGQGLAGPGCGSALVLARRSGRPWWTGRSTICTEKAVSGGYLGRGIVRLCIPPAFGVAYGVSERPFWGLRRGSGGVDSFRAFLRPP